MRIRNLSIWRAGVSLGIVVTASEWGRAQIDYTPSQISTAYGISGITFGSTTATGAGETIALIEAYQNPNLASDLATFDSQFSLPAPPSLTIEGQTGSTTSLPNKKMLGTTDWGSEAALDVEWAHALAPGANILVVEANSSSFNNLLAAVNIARNTAGVSVISNSWGDPEFNGETSYDTDFTTPSGHQGITFLASAGDTGTVEYPSLSPNVVSVGGTTLTLNADNTRNSETVWNDSFGSTGGGQSAYESEPTFQNFAQQTHSRTSPDVSFLADPQDGLETFIDMSSNGSGEFVSAGGTSAGSPVWAALIALADQGRALNGLGTTLASDASNGTLAALYALYHTPYYSQAFYDITSGSNSSGISATTGYDEVTGLGSPQAGFLIPYLAGSSVLFWTQAQSSTWSNSSNWTPTTPTATNDTFFNTSSSTPYTVSLTGASAAKSLTVYGDNLTLALAGNTLSVGGAVTVEAGYAGTAGSLSISGSGAITSPTFNVTNGTLQLAGDHILSTPVINLGNGTTTGTLDLDATNNNAISGLSGGTGNVITNTSSSTATLVYSGSSTASTFGGVIRNNGALGVTVNSGTLVLTGASTYSGATNVSGGVLVIAPTSGSETVNNSLNLSSSGGVQIGQATTSGLADSAHPITTITTPSLSISGSVELNLADAGNTLLISYGSAASPNATIKSEVASGQITSSELSTLNSYANTGLLLPKYAIGYGDGAITGVTALLGAAAGTNQEEVMVTYDGDATLDGEVDANDLNALAANFNTGTTWQQGDFAGDATTDANSLNILAQNFGDGTSDPLVVHDEFASDLAEVESANPAFAAFVTSVPEPGTLFLAGIGIAGLLVRRRRQV